MNATPGIVYVSDETGLDVSAVLHDFDVFAHGFGARMWILKNLDGGAVNPRGDGGEDVFDGVACGDDRHQVLTGDGTAHTLNLHCRRPRSDPSHHDSYPSCMESILSVVEPRRMECLKWRSNLYYFQFQAWQIFWVMTSKLIVVQRGKKRWLASW